MTLPTLSSSVAKFRVLGTSAGGGLPQWNCGCHNCTQTRQGTLPARTQSSAAFTPDGTHWYLIDASPDVARQLAPFAPSSGRATPVAGVLLTDAEFDHTLGLLQFREHSAWTLHATPGVHAMLRDQFPVLGLLEHYAKVTPITVAPGEVTAFGAVTVTWVPLDTHTPQYHHGRRPEEGATCALRLVGPRHTLVYAPSLSDVSSPQVLELLTGADILLLDGTFYDQDELQRLGFSGDSARSMGHLPMRESAPLLATLPARMKHYTHLNNTNPALDPASSERAWLRGLGLDLLDDGWETEL